MNRETGWFKSWASPGRAVVVAGLLFLGAVAGWLRVAPAWPHLVVAAGDAVVLPETDTYYHFRQAAYTLEHYPRLMRWDAGSHHPAVERNDAAGLHTLLLATLAKAVAWTTGLAPMAALHAVCLWLPPLLGALFPALIYRLVRRQASAGVALVLAGWSVLLPGDGLPRTSLGFCDHHMIEMLLSLLCIRGLAALRAAPGWRPAWGAAWPLAAFLFTWLGAPLHFFVVGLAFVGQLAADVWFGRPARDTTQAALRYWLAVGSMITVAGLLFPSLIMHEGLWRMTSAGALAAGPAFGLIGWWLDRAGTPRGAGVRLAWLGGGVALVGAVAVSTVPALRELAAGIGTHKSTLVAENIPVSFAYYWMLTGLAGVLALLAPLAGLLTGTARRPGWWLTLLPSLLLLSLWCRTYDYAYLGALHAVVLCGHLWGARSERKEFGLGPVALAAATLVIAASVAVGWTRPPRLSQAWYEGPVMLASPGWRQATEWLARQPAPREGAAAGVLTDWPHGNVINTLARLPAVSSRYPEPEGVRPLLAESEAEVRAAPLRGSTVAEAVRFVVLSPEWVATLLPANLAEVGLDPASFTESRMTRDFGGRAITRPWMNARYERLFASRLILGRGDGLAHFRLVFESDESVLYRLVHETSSGVFGPEVSVLGSAAKRAQADAALRAGTWNEREGRVAYGGRLLPEVVVYEQVAGARLVGRAAPEAGVIATLRLRSKAGGREREWVHRLATRADSAGNFTFIVPYATEPGPNDTPVQAVGPWQISWGDNTQACQVQERDVREGLTLDLADQRVK